MASTLVDLLSTPCPPLFIFVHHPHHASSSAIPTLPANCVVARVDGIEHHSPRLLYSSAATSFARRLDHDAVTGEISTSDGFSRQLAQLWATRRSQDEGKGKAKANGVNGHSGAEHVNGHDTSHDCLVLVITKAERLRHTFGHGWTMLTRLAELTGLPLTVLLASQMSWDELRPPRNDAAEPVHIYLPAPTREEILQALLPASAHPLWSRFLDLLLATALQLASFPIEELHYLSEALWPIYTAPLPPHAEQGLLGRPLPPDKPKPPNLAITVKLLTELKHQLALALSASIEVLLPRQLGRAEFINALMPRPGIPTARILPKVPAMELPLCAKFLLVAAYCASYNPAKSDVRLFGRGTGPDGKRRRGGAGGTRRAGYGKVRKGKVSQRLLGPKPFQLDRLLAMFASLYAEHAERPPELQARYGDDESSDDDGQSEAEEGWIPTVEGQRRKAERKREREVDREERWEDEVDHMTMSVKLWSLIPELEGQGLLRRMSPLDRLDNVMLRCELDYDTAHILAKDLKITLDNYLYETNS